MEFTTILTSTLLAAVVSAGVSAIFQIVVKNKEYRNDYYKKVIEKRMKAIESVEAMLSLFSRATPIADTDGKVFNFFIRHPVTENDNTLKQDDVFATAVQMVAQQSIWLSPQLDGRARAFTDKIHYIRYKAKEFKSGEKLVEYYVSNFEEIKNLKSAVDQSVAADMSVLYDVT
jgi:hypothetical protein